MEINLKKGEELNIKVADSDIMVTVDNCVSEAGRFIVDCDQPDSSGHYGIIYDVVLDDISAAESELIAAIAASEEEDEFDGYADVSFVKFGIPDPSCHRTGWSARFIDGRWCVGMTGNLDTIHDAVLVVNNHYGDDAKGRAIAEFVAKQYNTALGM